jgi:hypothetical protein
LGVAIALVAGCSSPPDQPAEASTAMDAGSEEAALHAPIDSTRMLASLTDDEWGTLCDWEADRQGGYNHRPGCDSNAMPAVAKDRGTCVAAVRITFPCNLIVSDFERCIDEHVDDPCALNFPVCDPILDCHDPPDARRDGSR